MAIINLVIRKNISYLYLTQDGRTANRHIQLLYIGSGTSINSVKVTFDLQRRDISTADDAKNVGVNVGVNVDELPDLQKFILKTIKSSPTITAKELSVQMSVSQRSIERHIAKLRELKLISREGSDKNGRWIVANM